MAESEERQSESEVPDDALLLTAAQVARLLQLSTASVLRLARSGELLTVNLGHRSPRFLRSAVDDFIASRTNYRPRPPRV